MTSGNAIKLGIVVVGFAAAVTIFAISGAGDSEPSVPADANELHLVCTDCGQDFMLAAAVMDEQAANTPQPTPPSGDGKPGFRFSDRRPKVVPCPGCSKNAAVLATACPEHGKLFPSKDMDGRRGSCPECN